MSTSIIKHSVAVRNFATVSDGGTFSIANYRNSKAIFFTMRRYGYCDSKGFATETLFDGAVSFAKFNSPFGGNVTVNLACDNQGICTVSGNSGTPVIIDLLVIY